MIPACGARTACETGIKNSGYRASGCPAETFAMLSTVLLVNPPRSKRHCRLIRTGVRACIAHLIRVGGMATTTGGISAEPVIQSGDD